MKTGIELIAEERWEQIFKHGRTIEQDAEQNYNNQLSLGALMLLSVEYEEGIDSESYPEGWDKELCLRMVCKPYKERLIIAAALLAAEIDRLQTHWPRVRFILPYPGYDNDLGVGDILTLDLKLFKYTHENKDWQMSQFIVEKYPAIFRQLAWWEMREEKDMPAFIKFMYDYLKFKKDSIHKYCNKWPKEILLPSTEQEYLQQQNKKG